MSAMSEMTEQTRLVGGGSGSLPRVNLLPPEIGEAAQFRKVQAALAGVLVVAVAGVGLLYTSASSSVSSAQDSLSTAQAETTTLQSQISRLANVTDAYNRAAAAQAMLTQAMGSEVRYSRLLNDLSLSIPDNVWLTNVTFTQPTGDAAAAVSSIPGATGALGLVTFTGVAFSHDDVAVWLEALAKQKGFADPDLKSSTGALIGQRRTVNWSVDVTLTNAALSGRYSTETGR